MWKSKGDRTSTYAWFTREHEAQGGVDVWGTPERTLWWVSSGWVLQRFLIQKLDTCAEAGWGIWDQVQECQPQADRGDLNPPHLVARGPGKD